MSAAAAWSYTHTATVWPLTGRDDWTGVATYGSPQTFACDYSAESVRMTDARGVELTSRQILYTERDDIKQGDMVLIGASVLPSPSDAGAFEVRVVTRNADTLDGLADDYRVAT